MTRRSRSKSTLLVLASLIPLSVLAAGCSHSPAASAPVSSAMTPQAQQAASSRATGEMNMARRRGEMMKRARGNQTKPQ